LQNPITNGLVFQIKECDSGVFYAPSEGTFYESLSPQEPPLVKAGDVVDAGTAICIISLSKVMQHIDADKKNAH
jgi:acetyl-CoA carboxylase biotin carboxyl carrier protein